MMSRIKKCLPIVLVLALMICSVCAVGTVAWADTASPVTFHHAKEEQKDTNLYLKFFLYNESGSAITGNAKTNCEGLSRQAAYDDFFGNIVADLNGDSFKGEHTFKELYASDSRWNLHVFYDAGAFMINANSSYKPVPGDTFTLLQGLRPIQNTAQDPEFLPYELSATKTVVYDNDLTVRDLPADEVWGIKVEPISVAVSAEKPLGEKVIKAYGSTHAVTYESSDPSVATVSESGVVTGVKEGTATITAKSGGKEASATVTVGPAITITKTSAKLRKGTITTATATSILADPSIEWTTSDESVASVTKTAADGAGIKATVTANGAGTATITATATNGNAVTLEVTVAEDVEVYLTDTEKTFKMGEVFQPTLTSNDSAVKDSLNKTAKPDGSGNYGANENLPENNIYWTLSNDSTVELYTSGTHGGKKATLKKPVFVAKAPGTVTATVTAKGANTGSGQQTVTADIAITVLSTVSVKKAIGIEKGSTYTIRPSLNPSTVAVTYESSDTSVATVSAEGVITAADKTGTSVITVKTSDNQTATMEVTVFATQDMAFTKVEKGGDPNEIRIFGYVPPANFNNFESKKSDPDFAGFYDNLLINGHTIAELPSVDGFAAWNNINVHVWEGYTVLYVYDATQGNAKITVPVGTELTFRKGLALPTQRNGEWVDSGKRIGETVTYRYLSDQTWAVVGGEAKVESHDLIEDRGTYYSFRVTLNVLAYEGEATEAAADDYTLDKIKINGYTLRAINEANSGAVGVYYVNKDIVVEIDKSAKMEGKALIDTVGHSTYFTICEGYKTPLESEMKTEYNKYYYGDMAWWSDAYVGKVESEQKITVKSITAPESDTSGGNYAFIVTFNQNVFSPTVHINGVCSWQNTTPYAGQIDGQLITGFKAAIWYGIKIDGKTVYDYMFKTGQSNATNQSTAIMVHADNASSLRIVFQSDLKAGFELGTDHTLEFLADTFYTNTGATFAADQHWSYSESAKAWTDDKAITSVTLDKTTATVKAGETVKLTATVLGNSMADLTYGFTSSDTSVATVAADGTVTAVSAGAVTVTVTASDGTTATCQIIVEAKQDEKPGDGDNNGDNTGDDNKGDTPAPAPAKKKCGGSVMGSLAFPAIAALIASFALVLRKKASRK